MHVSDFLFQPGRVVASPAALDLLKRGWIEPVELLNRHVSGDFGDPFDGLPWQAMVKVEHYKIRLDNPKRPVILKEDTP